MKLLTVLILAGAAFLKAANSEILYNNIDHTSVEEHNGVKIVASSQYGFGMSTKY
jgi:hypothetical protein